MGQKEESSSYAECLKTHWHLGNKTDGCQQFRPSETKSGIFLSYRGTTSENCSICGCHMRFHKRIVQPEAIEVVYTVCHKIDSDSGLKDGCQEFDPMVGSKRCSGCGCHKSFHRNERIKETVITVAGGMEKE